MEYKELLLMCFGSREKLQEYIENNVDLAVYIKKEYPFLYAIGSFLITIGPNHANLRREAENTTTQDILDLLKERRPELYEEITTNPKGLSWLHKQEPKKFLD